MADYSKFIEEQIKAGATLIIEDPEEYFGHTQISNIILLNHTLTDAELRVYLAIKSFAYGNKIHCWPGQTLIGQLVDKSRVQVCRIIQELVKKNLIMVIRRGLQQTNIYVIKKMPEEIVESHQNILKITGINKPSIPCKSTDVSKMLHQEKPASPVNSPDVSNMIHPDVKPMLQEENNTNVVVVKDNAPKKIDEPKNVKNADQEKICDESPTIFSPAAAPIALADINRVIDAVKDATGCVIKQSDAESLLSRWPVDYVLDKINDVVAGSKIDNNVTGWIIRCCERDWGKVKPDKQFKSAKSKQKKEAGNSYAAADAEAAEKRKALYESLYCS